MTTATIQCIVCGSDDSQIEELSFCRSCSGLDIGTWHYPDEHEWIREFGCTGGIQIVWHEHQTTIRVDDWICHANGPNNDLGEVMTLSFATADEARLAFISATTETIQLWELLQ